mgnify:CR=1 FL=1
MSGVIVTVEVAAPGATTLTTRVPFGELALLPLPEQGQARLTAQPERGFDLVDVNLSCPIRRVIGRGWGGAYLRDPERVRVLLSRVVEAVGVPVTLKFRSGWDAETINAPEIGRRGVVAPAFRMATWR